MLTVVEKLLQQDVGVGILVADIRFKSHGRSSVRFIRKGPVGLADRPAESAPAYLSRDRESEVRTTGTQFLGMKVFEKDSKEVLGRVIAGQGRECARDLGGGAMNGRNEDQQQESLPHRTKRHIVAAAQKIEEEFIGRGVLIIIVVVSKFLDEFGSGRKRGQYCAGIGEESKFSEAAIMAKFDNEAGV